jgi:hypothetical protein
MLLGISSIEVLKNLINYILTENSGQLVTSIISVSALNYLRTNILHAPLQVAPQWIFIESSIAEVLKNWLNFVVTEHWFPATWSKPPQSQE